MFKKAKIRNFCRFLCSLCGAIFSAVGVLQNAAAYSCAPGQYVNQNGGCTACPVGCWCVPGQNAATTTVTSVANMCSPSSTTYTGGTHGGENLGGGGAFKCPAGFSLSSASSDSATDCYGYVDSGYYIHSSGFKSASTYSCPVGSYCPGGTYYSGLNGGDHGVYACPDHSTTASKTSSSINQCICDSGYYMNGSNCVSVGVDYYRIYPDNSRYACSVNATTNGSTSASYCTCKTGYSGGGGQSDRSGSNCELVKPVIALQSNGATSVGTTAIYATYNTGVYSDPARTRPMSTNSKITTPIKTGYTFRGYYNSTIGTAQYINNSGYITTAGVNAATGYTSLGPYNWYAQWNEIDYTITYNLNGGTNPSAPPTSYSIESSAINLPTPTRDGYIFTGWYDNSSLTGSAVTTIPTGSTGNKEYWAKWEMSYPFSLTTTSMTANDTFKFSISASGNFVVDCGDGGVLSGDGVSGNTITRSNTTMAQYTCKYPTAGTHTIRFGGAATGYNATSGDSASYAAIGFSTSNYSGNTPTKIAGISGSLGAIFGTIGTGDTLATQPRFISTFASCSGLTGSIPENLFAGISGAPAERMFYETFAGCSGITGSIPENLFAGINGAPAERMFYGTFRGCSGLSGSIPENLFAGIKGAPAKYMFYETFAGCSGLTGSIPENLFAGISGAPAHSMFNSTFYNCSGLSGSIPENLFAGISGAPKSYMFAHTFDGCRGLTGSIPGNLFAGIKGAPKLYMFQYTFFNCSGLTGSIPENLFAGIKGAPAQSMFYYTFYGCSGLTGSIPENLFAGISGAPANSMFSGTFKGCSGLTGSIPEDLFAGISGAPANSMFSSTFSGCSGLTGFTDGTNTTTYIPVDFLSGITTSASPTDQAQNMFSYTGLASSCPTGTYNVTRSNFTNAGKPWCTPCPDGTTSPAGATSVDQCILIEQYECENNGDYWDGETCIPAEQYECANSEGTWHDECGVCETMGECEYGWDDATCSCIDPQTECENDGGTWHEECGVCETMDECSNGWDDATCACADPQTECENNGGTWHEECGVCETMNECADGWDDATCACIDPQTECENNGGTWDDENGTCITPQEECENGGGTWHNECGVCETMNECADGWDDATCACADPQTECENNGGTWHEECGVCESPGECAYGWDDTACACAMDPQTECENQGPEYYWDGSNCTAKDDSWCQENYGSDYYWNGSDCYYEEPDVCPAHSADSQNGIRILSNGALVIEYGEIDDCAQNIIYINNPGSFLQTENISDLSFDNNNVSMMYCLYNSETGNYDGQCTQKAPICSESEAQTLAQMSPYEILQAYINVMNFTSEQMENLLTLFQYTLTSDDIYSRCSVVSDCPTITSKTTVNGIPVWYGSVNDNQINLLPTYITKYNGECVIPGTVGNNMNNLFYVKNYTELVNMIDNGTQPTNDIKVSPLLEICSTDMTSLPSTPPEQLLEWYQTQLQSNASDGLKNAIKDGYLDSNGFFTLYSASEQDIIGASLLAWSFAGAYRCPITCNAGEYLWWPDSPSCDECPGGYYCPADSVTYTASEYNASSELGKTICPDGTTSPAGATSVDQCIPIEQYECESRGPEYYWDGAICINPQTECENGGGTWHEECGVCETMDECSNGWDDATCACADPQTECENNGGTWHEECGVCESPGECAYGWDDTACACAMDPQTECANNGGTWHDECGMCETPGECEYGWDDTACACAAADPQTECENGGGTWHEECGVCETMNECEYGWDDATCACAATDPQTECENNGGYWDTSEGEGICCAGDEHVEAGVCVPDLSPEEQNCIDTGGTWHEECGVCETMAECDPYGWDDTACGCAIDPQTECESQGPEYYWDGSICINQQTECENNGDYWDAGDSTCKNNAWCEENYGPDYYWNGSDCESTRICPRYSGNSDDGLRILSNGAIATEHEGFVLPVGDNNYTCINTIFYIQNPGNLLQTQNISDLSFDNNNVSMMYCIYNAETGNYDYACTQKAAICSESEAQTLLQKSNNELIQTYADMLNLTEADTQNPMDLLRYTVESDDIYERCGTSVDECPADYFVPVDHPGMCFPHVLHIGDNVVYLKSEKQTTPSLNINTGNDVFYANMTTTATPMNSETERYLKMIYNDTVYYVCDDTICGK